VIPTESFTETGGLSANLDNILLYGGGTYAQALQNLAKIILRHNGSGQLAGEKIKWDAAGNITMNDITADNLTVNSGTFNGVINANKGIRMGARYINSSTVLENKDSFVLIGGISGTVFYLPPSPLIGQMLVIKSNVAQTLTISGNGKNILTEREVLTSYSLTGWKSIQLMFLSDTLYGNTGWHVTSKT
jgi:hypothetical protein